MIKETTQVYILTEEGREYTDEGIKYVLNQIRNTFNDTSDVTINQGALYNKPDVLLHYLRQYPDKTYVFISRTNGITIMHDEHDIHQFINLLDTQKESGETSWAIIMKELNLL